MQVHAYLACAPRGAGVTAALFYAVRGEDVCGWLAHESHAGSAAAFFMLEQHYSTAETVFCRSVDDDVFGRWIKQAAPVTIDVRCPVAQSDCHELSRLQSAFVREWLFYPDAPLDHGECAAYRSLGLRVRAVNVRSSQFERFDQRRAVWVHASPGIDLNLVLYLKKRLPLDTRQLQFLP